MADRNCACRPRDQRHVAAAQTLRGEHAMVAAVLSRRRFCGGCGDRDQDVHCWRLTRSRNAATTPAMARTAIIDCCRSMMSAARGCHRGLKAHQELIALSAIDGRTIVIATAEADTFRGAVTMC